MAEATKFFMLKNVRVSFPHLFEPPTINGEEGKCGAVLLLDVKAHAKDIAALKAHIDALGVAAFKKALPADKICLRVGEEKRDDYAGYYALSVNHKDKPVVIGIDGETIITDKTKCPIYAGCRVNAKVSFWTQDNQFGKRVNGNLVAIQFAGDDVAMDGSYVPVDKAMEGFSSAVGEDFME